MNTLSARASNPEEVLGEGAPELTNKKTDPGEADHAASDEIVSNEIDRLCREARSGNRASFEALVLATYDRAYSVALNMLRSDADAKDVVQDAFLRVQRGLADFQGNSRFTTWLYRVVVNLCLDHLRSKRIWRRGEPSPSSQLDDLAERRPGPDDNASDVELRRHLEAGLASLSATHRATFLLYEVEGLSYEEIASVTGARVGTVMSRLFYARKKMQEHMKPHLPEGNAR